MKRRIVGLDIVRVIAIILVMSLHFILNTGYYSIPLRGAGMFILTAYEWLALPCIGLFLLLTGYFGYKGSLNKDYFYKLFKVVISYILISIIAVCFRIFYMHEDISLFGGILRILNFEADGYAWYVEMYLGLFLLIPFLNIIYDYQKDKSYRRNIIIVFLLITSVGPTFRFFVNSNFGYDILPNHWILLYPITYYFIGRYLRDYPLKFSFKKKFLILISTLLVQTSLCFFMNYGMLYPGTWFGFNDCGHFNLFTIVITVMIFSMFANVSIKNKIISKSISTISLVTFEMYLISWVVDRIIYKTGVFFDNVFEFFGYYVLYVGFDFIVSFVLAFIINKICVYLYKLIKPYYYKLLERFKFLKDGEVNEKSNVYSK